MIRFFGMYEGMDLVIVIAAFVLAIAFAMSSHEFAHAFASLKQGDDTAYLKGRCTLNPLKHIDALGIFCFLIMGFGWATPVPVNPLRYKDYRKGIFVTSIAGVLVNFATFFFGIPLYLACLRWLSFLTSNGASEILVYFVQFLTYFFSILTSMSLTLCLFNLLPIYPLDGYNVLTAFTKGTNKFMLFIRRYGSLILLALILTDVLGILLGSAVNFIENPVIYFWRSVLFGRLK